jgi:hypothetical protein
MISLRRKKHTTKKAKCITPALAKCRCGGEASKPLHVKDCIDRWIIRCQVERCYAVNIGQGLSDTVQGWNRLSTHFYR